jgi:hypothetical protein
VRFDKELQLDVVEISESKAGSAKGVEDVTALDAQRFEALRPTLELISTGAPEGDVVETNTVLVEPLSVNGSAVMLVQGEHRFDPHGKPEGGLVADEEWGCSEQGFIPLHASVEVADCHGKWVMAGNEGMQLGYMRHV